MKRTFSLLACLLLSLLLAATGLAQAASNEATAPDATPDVTVPPEQMMGPFVAADLTGSLSPVLTIAQARELYGAEIQPSEAVCYGADSSCHVTLYFAQLTLVLNDCYWMMPEQSAPVGYDAEGFPALSFKDNYEEENPQLSDADLTIPLAVGMIEWKPEGADIAGPRGIKLGDELETTLYKFIDAPVEFGEEPYQLYGLAALQEGADNEWKPHVGGFSQLDPERPDAPKQLCFIYPTDEITGPEQWTGYGTLMLNFSEEGKLVYMAVSSSTDAE